MALPGIKGPHKITSACRMLITQGYSAREIAVEALEALHLRSEMAVPLADAARKARQEQEWRDRMHDEMQDDW